MGMGNNYSINRPQPEDQQQTVSMSTFLENKLQNM
jgi:hypothetical protein